MEKIAPEKSIFLRACENTKCGCRSVEILGKKARNNEIDERQAYEALKEIATFQIESIRPKIWKEADIFKTTCFQSVESIFKSWENLFPENKLSQELKNFYRYYWLRNIFSLWQKPTEKEKEKIILEKIIKFCPEVIDTIMDTIKKELF